jgi:uncharacterized protein (TIGR00369 family)
MSDTDSKTQFTGEPGDKTATEIAREPFPAPIGRLLGLTLIYPERGRSVIEFDADERFANPMGTLHGGVLCDIADAAMGAAYRSTLSEDESFTTLELKINFLRPVWKAQLRARARVIQKGKTVGLVECEVLDEKERLISRASSTCMTLRGPSAKRREVTPDLVRNAKR